MAIKQRPDSPTNNFATLNPLVNDLGGTSVTFSEGNLKYDASQNPEAHINFNADSYFFEFYDNNASVNATLIIAGAEDGLVGSVDYPSVTNHSRIYYNGVIDNRGSANLTVNSGSLFNIPYSTVISVYKENKNTLILNSVATNDAVEINVSGLGEDFVIFFANYTSSKTANYIVNFGQDPTFGGNKNTPATVNGVTGPFAPSGDAAGTAGLFFYPPPAGALALCSANLPEMTPTVNDDVPKNYFKAVIWTGQNNAGAYNNGNVTVGFQPDLVWIKARETGYAQLFNDSLRGTGVELRGNETTAQVTRTDGVTAFNTTGFSVGTNAAYNDSAKGMVAWSWKAGGAPDLTNPFAKNGVQYATLSAANITAGTITPTAMSVNTDAGFSIVKITTSNVEVNDMSESFPHGLSKTPEFIIGKEVSGSDPWVVYHKNSNNGSAPTNLQGMALHTTGETYTNGGYRTYEVTSSLIKIGRQLVEHNNQDAIFYCWHSVEGYSKIGIYTGNGSADGPFVYCGFRPAWVMVKCVSTSNTYSSWVIYDSARAEYNPTGLPLHANSSVQENKRTQGDDGTSLVIDFLSNGIKFRNDFSEDNRSPEQFIFMAFAEQPFNYATAR
jgi:hypothetical protein